MSKQIHQSHVHQKYDKKETYFQSFKTYKNLQITFVSNKIGDCVSKPCSAPNSHCLLEKNKCVCNEGFVESPDERRCITKTAQLGQTCEMNEQCVRFDRHASCEKGTCRCLKNFTQHDDTCRSLVKIGEPCESNAACRKFTTDVTCIDHTCACDKNFVASSNGDVSFET